MRKKLIFVLPLAAATLFYLFNSCTDESEDWLPDERKEQLIEDAKRMYYGSAKEDFVELRASSNDDNQNLTVKPEWKKSKTEQDNTYQVLEIELQMEKAFNFATPESGKKFKQSKKYEYALSKTSLVYLTHKKTGVEKLFLMTIVPDLSYRESTKFKPFRKMSYLKRDNKFSGIIFYHNMDGEYVNGWRYVDGEVTATIQAHTEKPDFDLITTRSSYCIDHYLEYYVTECWYWGHSGEITGSDCYGYYEYVYWYSECYSSGGDGGYDGGGDDGTGGSSSTTYTPKAGDTMIKQNLPTTMTKQITNNTCVTSIMEFVNNKFFNKNVNEGAYMLSYLQNYGIYVTDEGVSLSNIVDFVNRHFTTSTTFTSFYTAVNMGVPVMTSIPTSDPQTIHNVLIVGFTSPENFIYMDPLKGCLQTAHISYFTHYALYLTGVK